MRSNNRFHGCARHVLHVPQDRNFSHWHIGGALRQKSHNRSDDNKTHGSDDTLNIAQKALPASTDGTAGLSVDFTRHNATPETPNKFHQADQ